MGIWGLLSLLLGVVVFWVFGEGFAARLTLGLVPVWFLWTQYRVNRDLGKVNQSFTSEAQR